MKPWLRVTYAVVQIGSRIVTSDCGMNFSRPVPAALTMDGAAIGAARAAEPARNVRRFMGSLRWGYVAPQHHCQVRRQRASPIAGRPASFRAVCTFWGTDCPAVAPIPSMMTKFKADLRAAAARK